MCTFFKTCYVNIYMYSKTRVNTSILIITVLNKCLKTKPQHPLADSELSVSKSSSQHMEGVGGERTGRGGR